MRLADLSFANARSAQNRLHFDKLISKEPFWWYTNNLAYFFDTMQVDFNSNVLPKKIQKEAKLTDFEAAEHLIF